MAPTKLPNEVYLETVRLVAAANILCSDASELLDFAGRAVMSAPVDTSKVCSLLRELSDKLAEMAVGIRASVADVHKRLDPDCLCEFARMRSARSVIEDMVRRMPRTEEEMGQAAVATRANCSSLRQRPRRNHAPNADGTVSVNAREMVGTTAEITRELEALAAAVGGELAIDAHEHGLHEHVHHHERIRR